MSDTISPNINVASAARALKAGEVKGAHALASPGDYKIQSDAVWEYDPENAGGKDTKVGEWVTGLAYACNLELAPEDLAGIAYELGKLVGELK